MRSVIGDRPKRREDLRFITGRGGYLDDLAFEGLAHAVVLRSPHAHAQIERTDIAAARVAPGVLAVLTAEEARADGLQPLRPSAEANATTGERFAFAPQPLLASGKVRYVGEPVALIVAESRGQALDAAEQVVVDYSPLPAVTTAAAARAPGARGPKCRMLRGARDVARQSLLRLRATGDGAAAGRVRRRGACRTRLLILWAARRVGRPVKWMATRSEGFLSDHQARDHWAEAALALDATGRFLVALRVNSAANAGAYLVSAGAYRPSSSPICRAQSTAFRQSSCKSVTC